jgi:ABC-2 type transport system permease protein
MLLRLVALDLKLAARGLLAPLQDKPPAVRIGLVVGLVVALHAAAWPVGLYLGAREAGDFPALVARTGALFVLPWAAASPMSALARLLAQRGDLDLLLASPLSARAIFPARLLAMALEAVSPSLLLLGPLADVCALQGRPHWLALYPALLGAGLIGAALGAAAALALAFGLGPRRARVVSQLAAAMVGGSAALAAQAVAFLPEGARGRIVGWLPATLLTLPERAALGEPLALAAWLALALSVFALAAWALAAPFARAALLAAGASAGAGRAGAPRFTAHLATALRRKEHRLLWRDPWLLSQMGLQALYTLPIAFILWRNGGVTAEPGVAFAPTLVVIAGQLSASLAWIALSAEEAPDFVATAPATRRQIERAKIAAIALPVALVMALPLAGLAFASPRAAAIAALCGAGAGVSGALLMLWRQAPARRGMVLRRHSQSKLVALAEHWLSLCWAGATGMAALGYPEAAAPLALAALTLWYARPGRTPAISAFTDR